MVEEDPLKWETEPSENFLPEHLLYRAIPKTLWELWADINKIEPNFFMIKEKEKGLSVDWSKYAMPIDTLERSTKPDLTFNGILQMNIGKLRDLILRYNLPIEIEHNPIRSPIKTSYRIIQINRAHSLLIGVHRQNRATMRRRLYKIAEWAANMKPKTENKK